MRNSIAFLVLIFCLYSCNHISIKKSSAADSAATPEALKDEPSSFSLISKSRGNNLIEELYNDQVEKRPELKSLEDDLNNYHTLESDSLKSIENYNRRVYWYYEAAERSIAEMKDSVQKKQILAIVKKSKSEFIKKSATPTALWQKLKDQDSLLNDDHIMLEVIITLPLIKRYGDNLPSVNGLPGLIKQKQKLIERTKRLGVKK